MLSQRIARLFRTGGRKKTKQIFGVVGTAVADSNHSNEMQPWGRACSIQHAGSWPHMKAAGCILSLLRVSATRCSISAVQHFSGAAFQRCSISAVQHFSGAAFQRCSISAVQHFSGAAFQRCSISAVQHFSGAAFQRCSISAVQHFSGAAFQRCSISAVQHFSGAAFQRCSISAVQHFSGAAFHRSWTARQTAHRASRSWFGLWLLLGSVIC